MTLHCTAFFSERFYIVEAFMVLPENISMYWLVLLFPVIHTFLNCTCLMLLNLYDFGTHLLSQEKAWYLTLMYLLLMCRAKFVRSRFVSFLENPFLNLDTNTCNYELQPTLDLLLERLFIE